MALPGAQQLQLATLLRSIGYRPGGSNQTLTKPEAKIAKDYGEQGIKQLFSMDVKDTGKDIAELSKLLKLEGTYKSAGNVYAQHDSYDSSQEASFSPEFDAATKGVSMKVLDHGKGMRQRSFTDSAGKEIYRGQMYREQSTSDMFKEGLQVMAPIALSFMPGLNAMLGSQLGLSGTMAKVAGGALLNTGMAVATGAKPQDALKSGLLGAAGSGLQAFGASSGWNPALTRMASQVVPGLAAGRDPRTLLMSAMLSQIPSSGNRGIDAFLQMAARQKLGGGK